MENKELLKFVEVLMRRQAVLLLLLIITFIPTFSCADEKVYRGPWRGRVIDAETKQPIEGAAVVTVWSKEVIGIGEGGSVFLDARETVTDKNGYFEIPPFKAISIPLIRKISRPPAFKIFKPGYGSFPIWQTAPKEGNLMRIFEKEGAVVELPKLSKELRLNALKDAEPEFGLSFIPHKKIKNFIKLLNEEERALGLTPRG